MKQHHLRTTISSCQCNGYVLQFLLFLVLLGLTITLGGTTYASGADITITDVGDADVQGENALLCETDAPNCCASGDSTDGTTQGEWLYPNNTMVPIRGDQNDPSIFRNRGTGVVRLNRRYGVITGATGEYCCEVPTMASPNTNSRICINLSEYWLATYLWSFLLGINKLLQMG